MANPGQALCGAKSRTGFPCRGIAMANGRCRMHGGTNPGAPRGSQNALKLGMYSNIIREDEMDIQFELGSVDAELHLCRLKLRRAVTAQEEWDEALASQNEEQIEAQQELVEVETQNGERPFGKDADTLPFSGTKKIKKRPNFEEIIYRLVQRIESLERTRKELGTNNDDDIRDAASKFRSAINEMDETVPPVDETKPDAGSTD